MPTNPNMVAIQTVTVGAGGASSITFSNIPQTYTDLVLKLSARSTQTDFEVTDVNVELNGSAANQTQRNLRAYPTTNVTSQTRTDILLGNMPSAINTSSTFANSEMYIANYTSSNNKSISVDGVSESNTNSGFYWWVNMGANLWSNSAAITSITLKANSGAQNFAQHTTATLYGVTSAGYGAKATGGIITQDANYYYHTFVASGTFTPTQSLTADCLVVAGGGGSGNATLANRGGSGGGGAGGVAYYSGQNLSATGYSITVGAGGAGQTQGSNSVFGSLTAAVGGGKGGNAYNAQSPGGNGGSGGGGGGDVSSAQSGGTATSGQGSNGGAGGVSGASPSGGGGGGAGATGSNGGAGNGGAGGNGINTYSSWATATSTGVNGFYAGGGGGSAWETGSGTGGTGGSGGGGAGSVNQTANGTAGVANTGGGAGAGSNQQSATGGSGIVIIRYAK